MQLTLPELVDLNQYIKLERTNRFMASKTKKAETNKVAVMAKSQLKPIDKIKKITFIWKHANKRKDMDNVEFSQKFIWDGLIVAGIIKNDSWGYRPPRTLHKHEVDKQSPGVLVLIK